MTANSTKKRGERDSAAQNIPLIEWIVGGVGLVLLIAIITLLVRDGFSANGTPPHITVITTSIHPHPHLPHQGHVVSIQVTNDGESAASNVWIRGELITAQGETLEQAQVQISFLPKGSHQQAGLSFLHDPQNYELRLRPLGFEIP